MTSVQQEPSANSPCTRTTLRALGAADVAAKLGSEINAEAAPANIVNEKSRLFILRSPFVRSMFDGFVSLPFRPIVQPTRREELAPPITRRQSVRDSSSSVGSDRDGRRCRRCQDHQTGDCGP